MAGVREGRRERTGESKDRRVRAFAPLGAALGMALALSACTGATSSGTPATSAAGKPAKDTTGGTPIPQETLLDNFLVRNAVAEPGAFPKAYRAVQKAAGDPPGGVNATGLDQLNISGSGQPATGHLESIRREVGPAAEILDLDLRAESHGFIDDIAVSWYAPRDWSMIGLTHAQILAAERERLGSLQALTTVELIDGKEKVGGSFVTGQTIEVPVGRVRSEADVAQELGMRYERIPAHDHVPLSPQELDRVVALYKQWRAMPAGSRLHVHCAGGDGRTTTVLVAIDILANAGSVSLDDIVARQAKLGEGTDLFSEGKPDAPFFYQYRARAEQIRAFYAWAEANPGGEGQPFSAWLAARN